MASTTATQYAAGAAAASSSSSSRQPKLDFHEAMRDFKSMFPSIENDVIETVLRANKGSVDATIDQLVAMGTEESTTTAGNKSSTTSAAASASASASRSARRRVVARPLASSDGIYYQRMSASGFNPPLVGPLPDDFLRIRLPKPRRYRPTSLNRLLADSGRGPAASLLPPTDLSPEKRMQILEDERVALFLQNEEFMKELRRNREFIESLERDQSRNHMLLVYPPKNRHPTATRPHAMHQNYNRRQATLNPNVAAGAGGGSLVSMTRNVGRGSSRSTGRERYREDEEEREERRRTASLRDSSSPPPHSSSSPPPPPPAAAAAAAEQVTTLHGLGFEAEEAEDGEARAMDRSGGKPHEELTFNEKLKHMSKSTRKKLHQLAQLFVRKKKKQTATLGAFDAASTVNLLNSEAADLSPSEEPGSREVSPEDVEYGEDPTYSQDYYRETSPEDPVEFYSEDFYQESNENDC